MEVFLEFFNNLTDPDWIVTHGGLYLLLFIVFAETGILIGFFLPGDPILFISGVIIANMSLSATNPVLTLLYWIILISIAAIVGNFVGYWCGKYFGHRLLKMKDNWLFKKEYIHKAQEFYEKRGGGAIILARFLPIVRTFAPIVAGIVEMDFRKFALYNIVGAIIWVGTLVTLGYLVGENPWVQRNLEYVIMGIVVLATAPVIVKLFTNKKKPVEAPAQVEEPHEV
ncbi:DedA family protein [Albibacterium bauzanense]|uniref:Membrane-associated protein n=1 Tax=Albibacterium bauzanense TaxID=653929 RepID=A0A4V2PXW0_9SPHI|nr:VTT domain-containing protein [Albibacterium bauzanense]TCK83151.1 membrane-associated protein [Albibacterium bauzanense]